MIITCKCGCFLTQDLVPAKKWIKVEDKIYLFPPTDTESQDNSNRSSRFIIRRGFYLEGKNRRKKVINYQVNPSDVIDQTQLKYVSGWGCCGNSYKPFCCTNCLKEVGYQFLDCYEAHHIEFDNNKINRFYMKSR